jgi:hypothetical protein
MSDEPRWTVEPFDPDSDTAPPGNLFGDCTGSDDDSEAGDDG